MSLFDRKAQLDPLPLIFRYSELVAIHGKLDPLVNVDLTPEKRVKVTFTYGDLVEVSNFIASLINLRQAYRSRAN